MALSGLWENVILTNAYIPQMAATNVQMTLMPKGGKLASPGQSTILTNVKSVVCSSYVSWEEEGPIEEWWQNVTSD